MEVILIALISALLSAALNYVNNILNSIVPIALHSEQYMTTLLGGSGFEQTYGVVFNFGISLIVLKFLKRAFDSYVLWQDGDPDADPVNLVTKFLRAIVIAVSFPTLYDWMAKVTEDMTNQILNSLSGSLSDSFANSVMAMASLNLFNAIVSLVFFICFFFLYLQFLMRGMEILILRMGVPIACTGLTACIDAEYDICCKFTDNTFISDRIVNSIYVDNWINFVKRSLLPVFNLRQYFIRHIRDKALGRLKSIYVVDDV